MCYYKFGDNMAVIYSYHDKDIDMHYSYDEKPNPSQFLMHTHEFYELLYFESGKGVYRVEGTPYTLQKGDIIIVRPAEAHYIDISESKPYSRISIAFNPKVFAEIDPSRKLLVPFDNRKIGTYNCYHNDNFKSDIYDIYIKNIICGDSNLRLRILTNLLPLLNEISLAFGSVTETEVNKSLDSRIISPSMPRLRSVYPQAMKTLSAPVKSLSIISPPQAVFSTVLRPFRNICRLIHYLYAMLQTIPILADTA